MQRLVALASFAALAVAASAADTDGWVDLLTDEAVWQKVDKGWLKGADAGLDPDKANRLKPSGGPGPVWVNGPTGRVGNLLTKEKYGDCEIHVEFLIAKGSNSGVKFQAVYEIQILDSFGKATLTGADCGGVYPRAEAKPKYHHIDDGVPPRVNACKKPGEWQTLEATYRAPRFNDKGEKVANAKLVKATLNGQVIHEDVEFKTPTGANYVKKETASGPFMIQADHGPAAFRNVRIRPMK